MSLTLFLEMIAKFQTLCDLKDDLAVARVTMPIEELRALLADRDRMREALKAMVAEAQAIDKAGMDAFRQARAALSEAGGGKSGDGDNK